MSKALATYAKHHDEKQRAKKSERKPQLNMQERNALRTMRREAREHGVVLSNNGEGGLPASLVLGVMRRDEYTCKKCGGSSNSPITVHHIGGVDAPTSMWLAKKAHRNDRNNLATVCEDCHDAIHEEDRALDEKVAKDVGASAPVEKRVAAAARIDKQ